MSRTSACVAVCVRCVLTAILTAAAAADAFAADRHALIVFGAAGGAEYQAKYDRWRGALSATLERLGYPHGRIVVLAENEEGARKSTGENVRAALAHLRTEARQDDVVLVLLIGHGTAVEGPEGGDGKFNLVGPDLTAAEWATLLGRVSGRLVFVNAASGSFPFLEKVAGKGRIVLTATDTAVQQYETVFPEYFIQALSDAEADGDKNGRVSVWEAFRFGSARVKTWFEERGQLATERPLLDDNGDGIGREAEIQPAGGPPPRTTPSGADGRLAEATYLQSDPPIPATADGELRKLLTRRAELQSRLDLLRAAKGTMPQDDYDAQLDEALVELAKIDQQIRGRR
jgi:hypothetical protein